MENNKDGILLETGTNEIEIMEFTIDGNLYGINVAKVREIMLSAPVHPMPHAHPAVEGIFNPGHRDYRGGSAGVSQWTYRTQRGKGSLHYHQFQ